MSKLFRILLLMLPVVLLLAACKRDDPEEEAAPEPPVVDETPAPLEPFAFTRDDFPRMDGSPSTAPLAEALAAVMLGQPREQVRELAMFTRTTQAFRNLAAGLCDILIVGEPAPAAIDEISRQDFRYDIAPIATDALVFVVSKSNPVDNLTSEQIKAIYSGGLTGWQQVGGNDLDIAAYQRNEEAASQILMEKLVMDWDKMQSPPMQAIQSGFSMFDAEAVPTAIKGFDGSVNAIGYTMYYYAANMSMADGYKILSVDGVMPTADTISTGAYPFLCPYYAVISKELPEDDNARILYNWLLSDEGQALISSEGYVSINDSPVPDDTLPVPPPQMRWAIATDASKLTPYSPRSRSLRIRDAALPALEPFDGYGLLLPYSTAVTMNDGSIYAAKYGFVAAQSGTVVTDPVYDRITRAFFASETGGAAGVSALPAYRLEMNLPENDSDFGFRTVQAACASDGSWITAITYENIIFRKNVMFCMYNDETFDIDVYDYSGNLLYNILGLEWADEISQDAWAWHLMYSESEGLGFILLDDDTYAVMDIMTGEIRETDFVDAFMFSDGLAAVVPKGGGGLWSYVNRDLEVVLPAAYTREGTFINGQAIVETPDGKQHVINKQGESLFSADADSMIGIIPGGYGYTVLPKNEIALPRLLTNDFAEIEYPPAALPLGPESSIRFLQNGRFLCMSESGTWLFGAGETIALPSSVQNAADYQGGYIVYSEHDPDGEGLRTGVMASDGTVVIEPRSGRSITTAVAGNGAVWFMVNTDFIGSDWDYFIGETYSQAAYELVDLSGRTQGAAAKTDLGILSYDEASGYFYVQGADYFAWLDANGETFISIPSMGYTYD